MSTMNNVYILVAIFLALLAIVSADSLSISSVKYAPRQEFKVTGTGNLGGSKLTLFSADSTGKILGPIMHNNMPMTTEVFGCINSVCSFEFQARGTGLPSKSPYVMVKSESGGVAGPYMVA